MNNPGFRRLVCLLNRFVVLVLVLVLVGCGPPEPLWQPLLVEGNDAVIDSTWMVGQYDQKARVIIPMDEIEGWSSTRYGDNMCYALWFKDKSYVITETLWFLDHKLPDGQTLLRYLEGEYGAGYLEKPRVCRCTWFDGLLCRNEKIDATERRLPYYRLP